MPKTAAPKKAKAKKGAKAPRSPRIRTTDDEPSPKPARARRGVAGGSGTLAGVKATDAPEAAGSTQDASLSDTTLNRLKALVEQKRESDAARAECKAAAKALKTELGEIEGEIETTIVEARQQDPEAIRKLKGLESDRKDRQTRHESLREQAKGHKESRDGAIEAMEQVIMDAATGGSLFDRPKVDGTLAGAYAGDVPPQSIKVESVIYDETDSGSEDDEPTDPDDGDDAEDSDGPGSESDDTGDDL